MLEKDFISHFCIPSALGEEERRFIMFIDFRDLNKATIKNMFPILRIVELLDELNFTKIDLRLGQMSTRQPFAHKERFV